MAGVKIGALAQGRDNNFNLIRLIAAATVLASHSYPLTGVTEPLHRVGLTAGGLAVDTFFATSGFLVTASLLRLGTFIDFLAARALRILPGLFIANIFAAFGVGAFYTSEHILSYFQSLEVYKYVFVNTVSFLSGFQFHLPGVFEDNKYNGVVNGSLWSLRYEVVLYALLLTLGCIAFRVPMLLTRRRLAWVSLLVTLVSGIGYATLRLNDGPAAASLGLGLSAHFFMGASFYLWREQITLHWGIALLALVAILGAAATGPLTLRITLVPALSYLVFFLAYVPTGRVRTFNRMGDYSYGLYIYAFPVQQALAASWPGITPGSMMLAAFVCAMPLAIASWHFVEKPMLARKRTVSMTPNPGLP